MTQGDVFVVSSKMTQQKRPPVSSVPLLPWEVFMFCIGGINIKNRVIAAPLAGVTDKAFRIIARSFGCGLVYTEMISDMGLVYNQSRTLKMADLSEEEAPIAVQIFGSEIEPMIKAARIVEKLGAHIIDINMGCPTPKIVKNGEGAALMKDLNKCRLMIREMVRSVQVPVTVKMRKGWDTHDSTCLELAGIAQEEGASAIALHPRSRSQFFSGHADWKIIKEIKKEVDIPVIGNGDIWSAQDAVRMIESTECDAVMIGRAAMGNPFIFRETVELLEHQKKIAAASVQERLATAIRQLELSCRYKGEAVAIREMRKHFAWYTKGLRGAARIREEINRASSKEELLTIIQQVQ